MDKTFDPCLYIVTDRSWLRGRRLEDQVEEAVLGGATMIQLREKAMSTGEFIHTAEIIKQITDKHKIPLIVNDRLDVALAIDADGLHVGQDDMPAATARRLLGPDKILGVSVGNRDEAIQAEQAGADYIGVGAVFPTGTKTDAIYVEIHELKSMVHAVRIPVIAIGGITESNVTLLRGTGIHGIAVVSAVFAQPDPGAAAERLKHLAEGITGEVAG